MIGFKKPATVGLLIPSPLKVIKHVAFLYYKEHQKLPSSISVELEKYFKEAQKISPHRFGSIVRRGFYVPGIASPPGPRSGVIKDDDSALIEIKSFYDFVIASKYDVEGADLGLVIHSYVHCYYPPLQVNPEVAYPGGAVTPSRHSSAEIVIEALWGHDEGIQSLPHDTYLVDFEKMVILEKKIQMKTTALKAGMQTKYDEVSIPPSHQSVQALNDFQIMQIASEYRKVYSKYGDSRLEFIVQPEGIVYIECTPFAHEETASDVIFTNKRGHVLVIKELNDIKRVVESTEIVAIAPEVVKSRSMDILTSLAVSARKKLVILYPGTATTAHAATIFREQGHTIVYSGSTTYEEADYIEIILEAGELMAKMIDKSVIPNIISLNESKFLDFRYTGGKAFRLFELHQFNVPIPNTIVLNCEAFVRFLKENSLDSLVARLDTADDDAIITICRQLRSDILSATISKDVATGISSFILNSGIKQFAIRSSANSEDGVKSSFAGQFDSFSPVSKEDVIEYIIKVWASTFNVGAVKYSRSSGILPSSLLMSVILQEFIPAEKAGVIFTRNIAHKDDNNILIEAVLGHGEQVVDGTSSVEEITFSRTTQSVVSKKGNSYLSDKDISKLVEQALYIERIYNTSQDIEWAIADDKVIILQTRPITT